MRLFPTTYVVHRHGNRRKPFERGVPVYYQPPKVKGKYTPHQSHKEKERRRERRPV